MQGIATDLRRLSLEAGADDGFGRGDLEGVEGGADVETRPADEHGPSSPPGDGGEVGARLPLVGRDAGLVAHVEHVELVVRYATALRRRQLRGADVHPPVELHGVGVDHLTAQLRGLLAGTVRPDLVVVAAMDDPVLPQVLTAATSRSAADGTTVVTLAVDRDGDHLPLAAARNRPIAPTAARQRYHAPVRSGGWGRYSP